MDPVFVEDCLSALDYKSVGSAALRRGGRHILLLKHLGVETLDWEFPSMPGCSLRKAVKQCESYGRLAMGPTKVADATARPGPRKWR